MQAIEHYNRNFTFGTAVGMTEDECHALHVQKGQLQFGPDGNKFPVILSGWRLTPEELKIIAETGIIWLSICGEGMPPVSLYAENPLFPVGMFTIMVRNHGHMATLKSMTTSVYVYWGHAQHVAVKQLRHHWMIKPRGVVWITPA